MSDRPLPAPPADVLAAPLGGEAVLLDLGAKRYFHLNATGAAIWDDLVAGHGRTAIAARLAATFDVTPDEARHAVDAFVAELRARSLVRDRVAAR